MPEDTNGTETTKDNDTTTTTETTPANFEDFMKLQPEDIQLLFTNEVAGLKSALSSERQQRKDNEAALRDAAASGQGGERVGSREAPDRTSGHASGTGATSRVLRRSPHTGRDQLEARLDGGSGGGRVRQAGQRQLGSAKDAIPGTVCY